MLNEVKRVFKDALFTAYNMHLEYESLKTMGLFPSECTLKAPYMFGTPQLMKNGQVLEAKEQIRFTWTWLHTDEQELPVLAQCTFPQVQDIYFYSTNDTSLGSYLVDTCLSVQPKCNVSLLDCFDCSCAGPQVQENLFGPCAIDQSR